jgi:acyl phosphate:glycerol-3-phosphate acyltransferase
MNWIRFIAAGVAAYLIGSIPVGYLVIYAMKGQDIRQHGSGRTGGTNALRAGGRWAGIATGAGDMFKGFLAVMVARWIMGGSPYTVWSDVLAGVLAVIGHNASIYLGFKGGAGTGPNIGAAVALWPLSGLWLIPMLPVGLNITRYASLTSIIIAILIPVQFAIRAALHVGPWQYILEGVLTMIAILWALRPNIKRLLNGTEPRSPKLDLG